MSVLPEQEAVPESHARLSRLDGRVALITGAGQGIGRAIAEELGERGAIVAASDISSDTARDTADRITASGGHAIGVELDVRSSASISAAVSAIQEQCGRVDVLVNNAAIDVPKDLLSTSETEWDAVHSVTLRGVFLVTRAVLPGMIELGRGAIVNIASVSGLAAFGSDAYSAAKAGVLSLTRNAAVKYGPNGIRVNAICPGTIATPAWRERLSSDPDVFDRLRQWYPVGRIGQPSDVSPLAAWLASDEAGFVTGAVFVVDGGLSAGIAPIAQGAPSAGATSIRQEESRS
jgi:meso-butanediol dehydrogenase/(S,S)-butanediol dehydrogenase/diacetyl reductase